MYLEISNPMDYHVALYIRLSKEDENEGPSQSVQNQESLLRPSFQRMIGDIETKRSIWSSPKTFPVWAVIIS